MKPFLEERPTYRTRAAADWRKKNQKKLTPEFADVLLTTSRIDLEPSRSIPILLNVVAIRI